MNTQKYLEETFKKIRESGNRPRLLLHSCCAPCSSYVLDYLMPYFDITVLYFNPNIYPANEFMRREQEQIKLLHDMRLQDTVAVITVPFEQEVFYRAVANHEADKEGGKRCFLCYRLRLEETANVAKKNGFDFFTTTLSISPHKNAQKINEIGEELARTYQVSFLAADFKKKDGYKKSLLFSKQYDLYRQDYCGCKFSIRK